MLFTDEWEAEDEGGVGVEVAGVGVTEGSRSDTHEALTRWLAMLQRDPRPFPSPAGTGIHWEHWPAVTMVSESCSEDMGKNLNKTVPCLKGLIFFIFSLMFLQILTERIQLLSPGLVAWLCPLNRWAQLWAPWWQTTAPQVRVKVMKNQRVSVYLALQWSVSVWFIIC